jgi:hypothetical protein
LFFCFVGFFSFSFRFVPFMLRWTFSKSCLRLRQSLERFRTKWNWSFTFVGNSRSRIIKTEKQMFGKWNFGNNYFWRWTV